MSVSPQKLENAKHLHFIHAVIWEVFVRETMENYGLIASILFHEDLQFHNIKSSVVRGYLCQEAKKTAVLHFWVQIDDPSHLIFDVSRKTRENLRMPDCCERRAYRRYLPDHMSEVRGNDHERLLETYFRWKQNPVAFWKREPLSAQIFRRCIIADVRDSWDRLVDGEMSKTDKMYTVN